jgi:hypothetical protein
VRQKASGNVIPTRKYRVLVTFSLAGVGGPRSCRSPGRFQRSLHMLYGRLSLRKYLCFHSEAQQARLTPRVITALPARPPQGERLCLILRNLARQSNPTHGDGHWLTAGSDWVHTSPHICGQCGGTSLSLGERAVIPSAPIAGSVARSMPGLSPRKPDDGK